MHAHAEKTEGKQHGSNAGVNNNIASTAAFQQALSTYTSLMKERFHRCVRTLPFINYAQELMYPYHQLPLDFNEQSEW